MTTVQDVLTQSKVENNLLFLPDTTLDRKLYVSVSQTLERIGGKWKGGKTSAFVFEENPSEKIQRLIGGEIINTKKEYQQFYTPANVVEEKLIPYAQFKKWERVLEPSAGRGYIVDGIIKHIEYEYLFLVEKDIENIRYLNQKYREQVNVYIMNPMNDDFLNLVSSPFDLIIANPPFTNNQDIDHVRKMYSVLEEGGRMIVITSVSWTNGSQKKQQEFRNWLDNDVNLFHKEQLPAGLFKESGTSVPTMLLVIDK